MHSSAQCGKKINQMLGAYLVGGQVGDSYHIQHGTNRQNRKGP